MNALGYSWWDSTGMLASGSGRAAEMPKSVVSIPNLSPSSSTWVLLSRHLGSLASFLMMVIVLSSSSLGLSLYLDAVEKTLLLWEWLPVLGPGRSTSGVRG
jgi:hypothetical protein